MKKIWTNIKGLEVPCKCINYRLINGFYVPCGRCIHCRKKMSQDWIFRCKAEEKDHFVFNALLTYDDEHLPLDGQLNKVHVQDFLKRFRFWLSEYGISIRYLIVGEYGGNFCRPHYHCLFFSTTNLLSPDLENFIPDFLRISWRKGFTNIEPIQDTAAGCYYMVAYMLSHDDGKSYKKHGKPFKLTSRRPAIGLCWIYDNPAVVKKCVDEMTYVFKENGYTKSLPRYIKGKIMPEEHKNYFADIYFEECKEFKKYLIDLEQQKKLKDYELRRKSIREDLYQIEREEYDRVKRHKGRKCIQRTNRDASQLFVDDSSSTLKGCSTRS